MDSSGRSALYYVRNLPKKIDQFLQWGTYIGMQNGSPTPKISQITCSGTQVIIVPHSHNDPGWLKTFTGYFESDTRQILNLVITKMQEYTDMTFIWSEISFLQMWWDQADPTNQRILKELIQSGRFEITTGGWVMTDEANVHIYAMLDQLIEGKRFIIVQESSLLDL